MATSPVSQHYPNHYHGTDSRVIDRAAAGSTAVPATRKTKTEPVAAIASASRDLQGIKGISLPMPSKSFSSDEMMVLLQSLMGKMFSGQINSTMGQLRSDQDKVDKLNKLGEQKLKDWMENCRKAEKAGVFGSIFGFVGKIATVLSSVVGISAVLKARNLNIKIAAPLMIMSVLALVTSSQALSKDLGGEDADLGKLMGSLIGKVLGGLGLPKEAINTVVNAVSTRLDQLMAGAAGAFSLPGELVAKACEKAGIDESVLPIINDAVNVVAMVALGYTMLRFTGAAGMQTGLTTKIQLATQLTAGVGNIGEGVANGVKTVHVADADKTRADQDTLAAIRLLFINEMDTAREDLQKVFQQMDQSTALVADVIQASADNLQYVVRNSNGQGRA